MRTKAVTFVFLVAFLHVYVDSAITNVFNATEATELLQEDVEAIPLPSWEVKSRDARSVEFRFYLPDSEKELDEDIVIEVGHRQQNASDTQELFVNGTTKDAYLTIYGNPGLHELRYRLHSRLGRSAWSEWEPFRLGEDASDPFAPIIEYPIDDSTVYAAGRFSVKWRVYDQKAARDVLTLVKYDDRGNGSNEDVVSVSRVANRTHYETSFPHHGFMADYTLTIKAVSSSGESSNLSRIHFRVYDGRVIAGFGGGVLLFIVLLGICICCCIRRRSKT